MRQNAIVLGWLAFAGFVLTIPLGNWVVMNIGLVCPPNSPCLIPVAPGMMAPSGVLLAGFALVLRDVTQEQLGARYAVLAIVLGAFFSWYLAEPALILGSTLAFLFSELSDFAIYTPLRKRHLGLAVMLSGLVGAVVDSAIFLSIAFGSLDYIWGQTLGKFWMSLFGGMVIVLMQRYAAYNRRSVNEL